MRVAGLAGACVATWLTCVAVLLQFASLEVLRGVPGQPRPALLAYLVALIVVPVGAAWVTTAAVGRRALDPIQRQRLLQVARLVAWPLLAGYLVTGVFGGPAVRNSYEHSMSFGARQLQTGCRPELDMFAAAPILPLVVVSFSEASGCGGGGGGFAMHFWDGYTVRRLGAYTVWQV